MCDGGRVEANQRRASDSRSRLTAWLATGVPCAQPGRDLDMKTLFRPVERSAQASAHSGASRRRTGCCAELSPPWLGEGEREGRRGQARGGEGRTGGEEAAAGTWASARQTAPLAPLALLLRQPEASGLPWRYDRLTPPTFSPTLANVDCRVKSPMETIRAYHQLLLLLAVLRLYHSVCTSPVHHRSSRHARRAGH
jgi:hypothetical protein